MVNKMLQAIHERMIDDKADDVIDAGDVTAPQNEDELFDIVEWLHDVRLSSDECRLYFKEYKESGKPWDEYYIKTLQYYFL